MPFERPFLGHLLARVTDERNFIQVVMGPRQVGKTTMVMQLLTKLAFPNHYASADAITGSGNLWLEQQWDAARLRLRESRKESLLFVVDEIQKIPNWSETVKGQWDKDSRAGVQTKVILLGSSRLLLQQGLTESLTGRFETLYLPHWSYDEMHQAFGYTAEQYVWFGGYPGSATLVNDEDRWKKYVTDAIIETSISRDILMLTRIDKPALLRKLFELGCLYSGQILSFNKMLGQLQDAGNTTTLSHYLTLLDTAGLLAGIEKYSRSDIKQRSSSPKFIVHNTALLTAQNSQYLDECRKMPDLWGRIVESSVGAHLINHCNTSNLKLWYWRYGQHEVDFVLEHKGRTIGIEVKSGATHRRHGVDQFKKEFNPDKIILVGEEGLPWQDFLKISPVDLFT